MRGNVIFAVLVGMLLALFSLASFALAQPALDLGEETGCPGQEVCIPIVLTNVGGTDVGATANDIAYDDGLLENPRCEIGPAGVTADKDVVCSIPAPGVFRVGVLGYNVNPIGDGIVAFACFTIKGAVSPPIDIPLGNTPSASDPYGEVVDVVGSGGVIEVTPPSAAYLDLGEASGPPCTLVTIPITLTDPDDVVVATENLITFDTTYLENPSCEIGPAGEAAGKGAHCAEISPGVYKVGVFGLNVNVIQDGVVAYVTFHIKDNAPCEIPPLETILLNDPSASDAAGGAVPIGGADGLIRVVCGPYITTACPLPECTADTRQVENLSMAGIDYEFQLEATGGTSPYTWDIVTGLPDGLVLDPDTGVISGNPQEIGQFCFTVQVTDALGLTDDKDCSMRVHLLGDADADAVVAITEIMTIINGYLGTFPDGSNCPE